MPCHELYRYEVDQENGLADIEDAAVSNVERCAGAREFKAGVNSRLFETEQDFLDYHRQGLDKPVMPTD